MGFEFEILNYLQSIRTPFLDMILPYITHLASAGVLWIVLTLFFLKKKETRELGIILVIAIILDVILCNGIIKNVVGRTRPYIVNPGVQLLVPPAIDYSFPSGHTAISFAFSSAVYFYGKKKFGTLCFVLSSLIGFTRLYLYVHYPSDVVCGALLGILVGYLAIKLYKKYEYKFERFLS